MAPFLAIWGVNRSRTPELLERDRHRVALARLDGRIRELASRQEICLLGGQGEQVGLRQGSEIALGDCGLDQCLNLLVAAVEQEADRRRQRQMDR